MYCPNCGKSEQIANSYCRACGEFLRSGKPGEIAAFGGTSPLQNVNTINFVSLFAAILSLAVGIWMYATQFGVPFVLYAGAAVLICNGAWHLSNFAVGMKLKRRLKHANIVQTESPASMQPAVTQDLLPDGSLNNFVSPSVTENTTKHLGEKIKRTLS